MAVLRDPATDRLRDEGRDRVFPVPADDALELLALRILGRFRIEDGAGQFEPGSEVTGPAKGEFDRVIGTAGSS